MIAELKEKKRKQDLGIFYTRPEIVDFMYDILLVYKEKEDKEMGRWNTHKPPHHPSVIDPACGEGIFLKKAIERGFTKPDWVFGMDIDEEVVNKWSSISLLSAFGGDEEKLHSHFFHQNGLLPIKWEQHKDKYYGRLKKEDIKNEKFNLVIGNPPYGGIGIDLLRHHASTVKLLGSLRTFNIFNYKRNNGKGNDRELKSDLFSSMIAETKVPYSGISAKEAQSIPIEVLFVERFIQLCKEGGWIAVIIPDGILANSNMHYVRAFISENAKVEAIVSLPRDAFKHMGTTAKTSILFLKKQGMENMNYPVFMASLNKMEEKGLKEISEQYKEFYYEGKLE
ncbi:MAG: SAM-dependent DNA methyltransferase [Nitrospirae bacterium]|nr:SAM-dependent DNA methyltransferase [Nitrospirota bacterium]